MVNNQFIDKFSINGKSFISKGAKLLCIEDSPLKLRDSEPSVSHSDPPINPDLEEVNIFGQSSPIIPKDPFLNQDPAFVKVFTNIPQPENHKKRKRRRKDSIIELDTI
jgi:hypothetical protein